MSINTCAFTLSKANGSEVCGETRDGDNHDYMAHSGCRSLGGYDAENCMFHEFVPGDPEHVIAARELRRAAIIAGDNGATALAEGLHLKAQDVFEAGEAAANALPPRYVAITGESVWLVEGNYVKGRLSFGYHMPTDVDYSGFIDDGYGIQPPKVGGRLRFRCPAVRERNDWQSDLVTSGVIKHIIPMPA